MFFKNVIGQEEMKQRLIRSVHNERISHAQLFTGPEGTGKLAMAIAYAQYISCQNRSETDSCGTCPSCHKYQKLAHPDLHFVFPIFNAPNIKDPVSDDFLKQWREMIFLNPYFTLSQWLSFIDAGNAQGLIYERESDSIFRKLNLKSFESEFKVMIIWLPEKMHLSCSNKLLKLIEEPPNKTLFLLITESEESIIPTIRSRAQLIKFPLLKNHSIKQALLQHNNADEQLVEDVVQLANGNYLKALQNLNPDDEEAFYFFKFQEMMRFAYKKQVIELIGWADEMAGIGRDRQKSFFDFALRLVREYFIMNIKRPNLNFLSKEEKNWGTRFSPFINEKNVIPLTKEFESGIQHISWNGNPKIILLDTALRMVRLIRI